MFKHKYIKNFISTKNTIEFLWNASKKNFTLLLICNILSGLACLLYTSDAADD